MEGIPAAGAQFTENGTYMSTEELLDGKQPGALMALVINSTLRKQEEIASTLRTTAMHDSGKGIRLNISA